MANKNKKKKTFDRAADTPLWMIGIFKPIDDQTTKDLKKTANIMKIKVSGSKTSIKSDVLKEKELVIARYKKAWRKKMKIFKNIDYQTFSRFCISNDCDFVMSNDTLNAMQQENATIKDVLVNAVKQNDQNMVMFKFSSQQNARVQYLVDEMYKGECEYSLQHVIANPLLGTAVAPPPQYPIAQNNNNMQQQPPQNNNNINNVPQNNNNNNINNAPQNNNNNDENELKEEIEKEKRTLGSRVFIKDSNLYKMVVFFINMVLVFIAKNSELHPNIISNGILTQKINNNISNEFRKLGLSGKQICAVVVKILYAVLGMVDVLYEKDDVKKLSDKLNGGMDESDDDDDDDDDDGNDVSMEKKKCGWSCYWVAFKEPQTDFEDDEIGEDEKATTLKDFDFWNPNVINYVATRWPQKQDIIFQKCAEYGIIKPLKIPQNKKKKLRSREARLEKLKMMGGAKLFEDF